MKVKIISKTSPKDLELYINDFIHNININGGHIIAFYYFCASHEGYTDNFLCAIHYNL